MRHLLRLGHDLHRLHQRQQPLRLHLLRNLSHRLFCKRRRVQRLHGSMHCLLGHGKYLHSLLVGLVPVRQYVRRHVSRRHLCQRIQLRGLLGVVCYLLGCSVDVYQLRQRPVPLQQHVLCQLPRGHLYQRDQLLCLLELVCHLLGLFVVVHELLQRPVSLQRRLLPCMPRHNVRVLVEPVLSVHHALRQLHRVRHVGVHELRLWRAPGGIDLLHVVPQRHVPGQCSQLRLVHLALQHLHHIGRDVHRLHHRPVPLRQHVRRHLPRRHVSQWFVVPRVHGPLHRVLGLGFIVLGVLGRPAPLPEPVLRLVPARLVRRQPVDLCILYGALCKLHDHGGDLLLVRHQLLPLRAK